ncbi:MAG TPA: hypothetical protein VF221_04215 [Chloroflexota bacterium]
MSLQRHDLHDELVALIAAGRELPAEHDRVLADVFLDHARNRLNPQPAAARLLDLLQDARVLGAALCLALASFLFGSWFAAHAAPLNRAPQTSGFWFGWHDGDNDHSRGLPEGQGHDSWPFLWAPANPSQAGN